MAALFPLNVRIVYTSKTTVILSQSNSTMLLAFMQFDVKMVRKETLVNAMILTDDLPKIRNMYQKWIPTVQL